jgi:hypothetical protein
MHLEGITVVSWGWVKLESVGHYLNDPRFVVLRWLVGSISWKVSIRRVFE